MSTLVGLGCREDWCDFKRGEGMAGWTFGASKPISNHIFDLYSSNRCDLQHTSPYISNSNSKTTSNSKSKFKVKSKVKKVRSGWDTDSSDSSDDEEEELESGAGPSPVQLQSNLRINPYSWSTVDIVPCLTDNPTSSGTHSAGSSNNSTKIALPLPLLTPLVLVVRDNKNKRRKSDKTLSTNTKANTSGGTSPTDPTDPNPGPMQEKSHGLGKVLQSELLRVCTQGGLYSPCYLVTAGNIESISKLMGNNTNTNTTTPTTTNTTTPTDTTEDSKLNFPWLNFDTLPNDRQHLEKLKNITKQQKYGQYYFGCIGKSNTNTNSNNKSNNSSNTTQANTPTNTQWSSIELEILIFKIIVSCHINKSCNQFDQMNGEIHKKHNNCSNHNNHNNGVDREHTTHTKHAEQDTHSSKSIPNPMLMPSYQDELYVIRGVQFLLQMGVSTLPYILYLQQFNIDIKRCIRIGNQMYQNGVQCCSDNRI